VPQQREYSEAEARQRVSDAWYRSKCDYPPKTSVVGTLIAACGTRSLFARRCRLQATPTDCIRYLASYRLALSGLGKQDLTDNPIVT